MTIPFRKLLAVTILFSSSFAWFFVFYSSFDDLISPGSLYSFWYNAGTVVFLVSIVVSAFIGSVIAAKVNRRKMLLLWLVSGVVATIPILFFRGDEFLVIWGMMAGLSFGVGFPSCQAFLADSTAPEERGRVAGLVILATFVLVVFSSLLKPALGLESAGILLLTVGIKSIGFLSFALDPIDRVENEAKPWRAILGYRDFNLYLMAFVLFMVAAGLVSLLWQAVPQTPVYDEVTRTAVILRYVGLCVFAIIAGLMADRIGRKRPIILGLVMLGAAYAIVGLLTTPETYFVNLLLSGFAWGIIMVVYLVVPGDLTFAGSAERFYTVGWVLPLILYIGVEGTGKLIGFPLRIDIFSTILSIVLFASVLPLLSAVETLSESKLRERRFREYAEKVGKVVQESKETDQT
jgi:MFS family permease